MTTMTATTKTPEEIDSLKRNWSADPCYDIEDVEGFEAYHDQLYIYRLEVENAQMSRQLRVLNEFRSHLKSFVEGDL